MRQKQQLVLPEHGAQYSVGPLRLFQDRRQVSQLIDRSHHRQPPDQRVHNTLDGRFDRRVGIDGCEGAAEVRSHDRLECSSNAFRKLTTRQNEVRCSKLVLARPPVSSPQRLIQDR